MIELQLASKESSMTPTRRQALRLAGAAIPFSASWFARANSYPSRPVRIIVGYAAGGAPDILARLIGRWLSDRLGQPFVVENKPGASGRIAIETVVRAPPDGYTLLLVALPDAVNATLYQGLNYSFVRDIAPIAATSRDPDVMLVNRPFPPNRSQSSLPMTRQIPARSTWRPLAWLIAAHGWRAVQLHDRD